MVCEPILANAGELAQTHYSVKQQVRFLEDYGEYHTYGIMAIQQAPEGRHYKTEICDIATDLAAVQNLADRFNRGELSVIHFRDAVEDWLDCDVV